MPACRGRALRLALFFSLVRDFACPPSFHLSLNSQPLPPACPLRITSYFCTCYPYIYIELYHVRVALPCMRAAFFFFAPRGSGAMDIPVYILRYDMLFTCRLGLARYTGRYIQVYITGIFLFPIICFGLFRWPKPRATFCKHESYVLSSINL